MDGSMWPGSMSSTWAARHGLVGASVSCKSACHQPADSLLSCVCGLGASIAMQVCVVLVLGHRFWGTGFGGTRFGAQPPPRLQSRGEDSYDMQVSATHTHIYTHTHTHTMA
jgi:hypothetical protein